MGGRRQDGLHLAAFHRLAGVDDAEIVAQLGDHPEIVGHEQQRYGELVHQLAQQAEDFVLGGDVQGGGRLVGDHQTRRAGQGRRDQQALALAAGELVRIALQRGLRVRHLHALQQADQAAGHAPAAVHGRADRPPARGRA